MKILIYSHGFAPLIGGVETYAMLLAQGLTSYESNDSGRTFHVQLATPMPKGDFDDSQLDFEVLRQPGVISLFRAMAKADIIHLCGPSLLPQFLSWLLRKPVVIEQHGYQTVCPNGSLIHEPEKSVCPGHFLARRYGECVKCNMRTLGIRVSLQKLLLTFPRRWLCQRAAANAPITKHVSTRLALHPSQVIYYGILDTSKSSSSPEGRPDGPLRFAYVGRFVSEKGLPTLLHAARALKDGGYKFIVEFIGDGPERGALEALAKELQIQDCLDFTGFLTGERLHAKLRTIAVVVMPSICEETAGLAAIEQMMAGRLVIASDIGGLGEVVGDAGLKCVPGDAASLAECMRQALDAPQLIDQKGAAARRRALELFTQPRMIEEYARLYGELVPS